MNKIIKVFKGIGICTDCGKEEKVTVLSHQFSAYHDILVKCKPAICTFIGFHKKQICNSCWREFMDEYHYHWISSAMGKCKYHKETINE